MKKVVFAAGFVSGFLFVTRTISHGIRRGRWLVYDLKEQQYLISDPEVDPFVLKFFSTLKERQTSQDNIFGPLPDMRA